MGQNQKTTTLMMTVIRTTATALGACAVIAGAVWISYKTDEAAFKHHAEKYSIMTMGADVARNCLAQCKDKAVERYYVAEGKLVCECSKVKSPQKK